MTMILPKLILPLAFSAALLAGPLVHAQTLSGTGTTTVSTSRTVGVVNSMGPDALVIRSETSTLPLTYSSTGTTSFVDETGTPVAREVVASGLPVTVEYSRDGERLIANRVVVHRQTTSTVTTPGTPAVIEKTVTSPPVVVEKKVYVDRPVIVEKKVPVDRPVIVEKKVPVDRPVIVEKQVPAPVVEETKTTRTTTTTTSPKKDD